MSSDAEWQAYYESMTPAQRAEWEEGYKAIQPLVSKIPPVLAPVQYLSREQCTAEGDRIRKQFVVLHDLPKMDGKKPDEYMHETLELLRQRCVALHWRLIQLDMEKYKKLRSA